MDARLSYIVDRIENGCLLEKRFNVGTAVEQSKRLYFPDLAAVREHIYEDLALVVLGEEERAEKERQEEGGCCEQS